MFDKMQIDDLKKKASELMLKKFSEGNDRDAELLANQVIKIDPENANVIQLLGLICHKRGDFDSAVKHFDMAISIDGSNYENHNNLGLCYAGMGRYKESIDSILKAIDINPGLNFVHSNLGLQYRNDKQVEKAIGSFLKSISIKETPETWGMLGGCYGELRNLDEAEKCFRKSLDLNPDFAAGHVDLASIHQLRGEWDKAWPEYEWRFKVYDQTKFWDKIYDPKTKWNGRDDISGKTVLVHSEQGTGDVIHFFRYVKLLREKGARVVMHCWDSLQSLFDPYVDEVYVKDPSQIPIYEHRDDSFGIPPHDYQCSIVSLPFLLGSTSIPKAPYLDCSTTFNASDYSGFTKVGIAWAGNPQHPNDAQRSCQLKLFKGMHDIPGVKLFNLQKDTRPRMYRFKDDPVDLTDGTENMSVVDVSEFQTNFEKTASIIKCMDIVVTVDTAVLHLSGALGTRTLALISCNGDWRWKRDGGDNDWYDSVTLFRQDKNTGWSEAFAGIEEIIRGMK